MTATLFPVRSWVLWTPAHRRSTSSLVGQVLLSGHQFNRHNLSLAGINLDDYDLTYFGPGQDADNTDLPSYLVRVPNPGGAPFLIVPPTSKLLALARGW